MDREGTLNGRKVLIVGLTLFSMFFGAGNLIFPPFLAVQAGTAIVPAAAGFLVSAVGLPVLGVVAVARSGGLSRLAGRVHPVFALVFTILIYLSIGPCLAIPRTASTSFEMTLLPLVGESGKAAGQLIYSIVFFAIAAIMAFNPDRLTDRLGKILCPTLLFLIFIMFAGSVFHHQPVTGGPAGAYNGAAAVTGFLEGYQTMDTIAALNFGIVIALNIRALGVKEDSQVVKTTIQSGIVAGILLALVYAALSYVGGQVQADAAGLDNGARILTFAAGKFYGNAGAVLLGIIFFIACLNTCIGLLSCCSKYFSSLIPRMGYHAWVILFAVTSVVIANAGLDRILAFSVPVLNAIYPVAIVLIVLSFMNRGMGRGRGMYPWAISLTAVVSIIYALEQTKLPIPWITKAASLLPGYGLGLGWMIPAAAGMALGLIFGGKNREAESDNPDGEV